MARSGAKQRVKAKPAAAVSLKEGYGQTPDNKYGFPRA